MNAGAADHFPADLHGAPLCDGWRFRRFAPGSHHTPDSLDALEGDWLPATVPGTVASSLRDTGTLDFAALENLDDADYWIHHRSFGTWRIKQVNERRGVSDSLSEGIVSPMPGMVIAINVSLGDQVKIGDPLVVIEAMKMEHIVRAKRPGRVVKCNVSSGSKVRVGQVLVEVVGDV